MRRILKSVGFVVTLALMILWAGFTIAAYQFGVEGLFYVTFPGLICGLMITGGHGGTVLQERTAEIVAVVVNVGMIALAYITLLYWIPRGLHHKGRIQGRRAQKSCSKTF